MSIRPADPSGIAEPDVAPARDTRDKGKGKAVEVKPHSPFIGFAAGLCSGWTKLVVGHPFDTIKVSFLTFLIEDGADLLDEITMYSSGALSRGLALFHIDNKDRGKQPRMLDIASDQQGPRALYKGASVPAISWGITDSILMGRSAAVSASRRADQLTISLHNYRAFLRNNGFAERDPYSKDGTQRLSLLGHTIAGAFAGWTNAVIAHPTETIKCKLQLQLVQSGDAAKQFAGPVDVVRQTIHGQGITGMWKGVGASFIYRSCFAAMFGGFEIFNRLFKTWEGTSWEMSPGMGNFMAGGLASNMYWLTALPLDNVKNRIMVDSINKPRFSGVIDAYSKTWWETFNPSKSFSWNAIARTRNFYKGFVPVVLRAFPTNAAALAVWEGVMRWSAKNDVSF